MSDLASCLLDREEPFFSTFSREFVLNPDVIYLMAGQKGSMPAPVLRCLKEDIDALARDPFRIHAEDPRATREAVARGYRAHVDEIAITRNATDALTQILMGIDWQPGDEALVSPLEHPAGIATLSRIACRYGVAIRVFGLPEPAEATAAGIVEAVARRIRPGRTKLLFFSSPLWPNGMRMPERALAQLAQAHGIITVVDGAHFAGMLAPELSASGVDFWAFSGHKWQCGPGGTGVLYARNRVSEANPNPLPHLHLIRSAAMRDVPFDGSRPEGFDIGSALTQSGAPEGGLWHALSNVCRRWDEIGRARIEAWILGLADYMRERIAEAFGPQALLQPTADVTLASGIVAFNPFVREAHRESFTLNETFREQLLTQYRIRISGGALGPSGWPALADDTPCAFKPGTIPNRDPYGLKPKPLAHPHRANACVWTQREQVDHFVTCARQLARTLERRHAHD